MTKQVRGRPAWRPVYTQIALVLVLISALAAIGAVIGVVHLPGISVTADLEVRASSDGSTVRLEGSTTVPDGSEISCQLTHELEQGQAGTGAFVQKSVATVDAGEYLCSFDVKGWPPGRVQAAVRFAPYSPDQPPAVRDRYGSAGEYLVGPHVTRDSDGQLVQVITEVELS